MHWIFEAGRRLREHGILGMNRRNAACILDRNPRSLYPLVDDKLRMHALCRRIGVPTPEIYTVIRYHSMLRRLDTTFVDGEDFVIKPNRGSGGRGVLVVVGRDGDDFLRHNEERLRPEHLRQHVSDILSGLYSLGGRPDEALVQRRVRLHPGLEPVAYKGIPDVRVILYRNEPVMAMLRLPTRESGGRANLHQGGIGAGVELHSGRTHHAVQRNRSIAQHPDTGRSLVGVPVPHWRKVVDMAVQVAQAVGLGYIGVDIIIDAEQGPMLLEANARPGLAIQIANGRGLVPLLDEIDRKSEEAGDGVLATLSTVYRKSA
jgi:alpha-L-glutamate ligase-like protein